MATLTMLMSTSCMKPAVSTTARATQRRGAAPPGARPGSAGGGGGVTGGPSCRRVAGSYAPAVLRRRLRWGGVGRLHRGQAGQQGRDQRGRRVGAVAEGEEVRPGHQLAEHQPL